MSQKIWNIVIVVALIATFFRDSRANVPFTAINSKMIQVTNAAQTVKTLLGADTGVGECFKVANPSSTLLCLGDSGVDNAVAVGDDCWPICSGGAFCAESVTSIPYSIANTYLRSSAATLTVTVLLGNGC